MTYITKTNLSLGPMLGSQMTQYAGLYSISRKTGLELVFIDKFMSVFRGVKLFEAFSLTNKIISADNITFNKFVPEDSLLDEKVFELDVNKNWDIGGLFHTFKYFHEYRQELLTLFTFNQHIQHEAKRQINVIRNDELYPLVSLHVRRGDYLQVSSLNLQLSYYDAALNILFNKFDNSYFKLLVFSDDISWCKDHIKGENVLYIEHNTNYVDMCMMTMCDHHIIANSSFSWWGAYLNPSTDKIVICPTEYIGPSAPQYMFINGNYFPSEWLSI